MIEPIALTQEELAQKIKGEKLKILNEMDASQLPGEIREDIGTVLETEDQGLLHQVIEKLKAHHPSLKQLGFLLLGLAGLLAAATMSAVTLGAATPVSVVLGGASVASLAGSGISFFAHKQAYTDNEMSLLTRARPYSAIN